MISRSLQRYGALANFKLPLAVSLSSLISLGTMKFFAAFFSASRDNRCLLLQRTEVAK